MGRVQFGGRIGPSGASAAAIAVMACASLAHAGILVKGFGYTDVQQIRDQTGGPMTMYVVPLAMRVDMDFSDMQMGPEPGETLPAMAGKVTMIFRVDKEVIWTLFSGNRTYQEKTFREHASEPIANMHGNASDCTRARSSKVLVGYKVYKYRCSTNDGDTTMWGSRHRHFNAVLKFNANFNRAMSRYSKRLSPEEPGLILESRNDDGKWTWVAQSVRKRRFSGSTFEVPKGFKRLRSVGSDYPFAGLRGPPVSGGPPSEEYDWDAVTEASESDAPSRAPAPEREREEWPAAERTADPWGGEGGRTVEKSAKEEIGRGLKKILWGR